MVIKFLISGNLTQLVNDFNCEKITSAAKLFENQFHDIQNMFNIISEKSKIAFPAQKGASNIVWQSEVHACIAIKHMISGNDSMTVKN